jgi:hypothetical protein
MNETTKAKIMSYVDFHLTVDTEPDQNGCMWVTLKRWHLSGDITWDMSDDCVKRLRDACNVFLERLDAIQHEDAIGQ